MRGEIIGVWSEMWRQVWRKLADHKDAPDDLFCELFRELNTSRANRLDPATELVDIVDDPDQARVVFRQTKARELAGELALIDFLERAHGVIEDFGEPNLVRKYFCLIEDFIEKYSLRYDLRRPFSLHPTLPGVFARLISDLRDATAQDAHLNSLMHEFEEAIRDLKADQSSAKIKTCIHKQMNLLEGITCRCDGVTADSLGEMCNQVSTWPHATIKEAMKKLYGFSSSYPGIRHGGNPASALREIEMRDLVAVSVMLVGFAPYLSNGLDSEIIYRGDA